MCPAPEFDADLRYGIFVFEKLSDDECRAWQQPNLERSGLYEDGWTGRNVSVPLDAQGGRTQRLKIAGLVPLIDDGSFETELTVSIDGRTVGQVRLGLGHIHIRTRTAGRTRSSYAGAGVQQNSSDTRSRWTYRRREDLLRRIRTAIAPAAEIR